MMDAANPRYSTSDALLEHALEHAAQIRGADTRHGPAPRSGFPAVRGQLLQGEPRLHLALRHHRARPHDQLTEVYEGLVHWADVVILATPIRWGAASALYFKMAERLNCVQNQITTHNKVLIDNKVASFIITGGQDNIQGVAGGLLTFWSELGFHFPKFPFIAHSRGWDAEDMQNNVRQVRHSEPLREATRALLDRSLDHWRVLDASRSAEPVRMVRAGRKANPLDRPEEEAVP